jgi:hypothetical protein
MSDTVAASLSLAAIGAAVAWEPLCRLLGTLMALHATPVASPVSGPAVAPEKVSFAEAIDALAVVRNRLAETGCLNEPAAAAVEAITHALVLGTDK